MATSSTATTAGESVMDPHDTQEEHATAGASVEAKVDELQGDSDAGLHLVLVDEQMQLIDISSVDINAWDTLQLGEKIYVREDAWDGDWVQFVRDRYAQYQRVMADISIAGNETTEALIGLIERKLRSKGVRFDNISSLRALSWEVARDYLPAHPDLTEENQRALGVEWGVSHDVILGYVPINSAVTPSIPRQFHSFQHRLVLVNFEAWRFVELSHTLEARGGNLGIRVTSGYPLVCCLTPKVDLELIWNMTAMFKESAQKSSIVAGFHKKSLVQQSPTPPPPLSPYVSTTFHGACSRTQTRLSAISISLQRAEGRTETKCEVELDESCPESEITLIRDGESSFHILSKEPGHHPWISAHPGQKRLFQVGDTWDTITAVVPLMKREVLIILPFPEPPLEGVVQSIEPSYSLTRVEGDKRVSIPIRDHFIVKLSKQEGRSSKRGYSGAAVVLKREGHCVGMLRGGSENNELIVACIPSVAQCNLMSESGWRFALCSCMAHVLAHESKTGLIDTLKLIFDNVFTSQPPTPSISHPVHSVPPLLLKRPTKKVKTENSDPNINAKMEQ